MNDVAGIRIVTPENTNENWKGKLPERFKEDGFNWQILERVGNIVFLQGQKNTPMYGGSVPRIWAVCTVRRDEAGIEYVKTLVTSIDKDSPHNDRTRMEEAFRKSLEAEESRKARLQNQIDAEKEQRRTENIWREKTNVAKSEHNALIVELKALSGGSDDLRQFEDKKIIAILNRIHQIEVWLHHGRPGQIGRFN